MLPVHIRWGIRRDLPEVLEIEKASFAEWWTEDDFLRELRRRSSIMMVAEVGEAVAGYMIYDLGKTGLVLINFAVHPTYRLCGVGRQMLAKLASKLTVSSSRKSISVCLRESNLNAQLFFRACGYECVNVHRGYYDDTGEDAYRFARFAPHTVDAENLERIRGSK